MPHAEAAKGMSISMTLRGSGVYIKVKVRQECDEGGSNIGNVEMNVR